MICIILWHIFQEANNSLIRYSNYKHLEEGAEKRILFGVDKTAVFSTLG